MNFTEYMNKTIYGMARKPGDVVLALGEKKNQFDDAFTIDIEGGDINADLNAIPLQDLVNIKYDVIRAGEILEHLTSDYFVLRGIREILKDDGVLLVTVPYYGVADYHVRLHNKWSIVQLLNVAGFEVFRYIPRKAPRIDRFIAYIRGTLGLIGISKDGVNRMFLRLNAVMPFPPNGGYLFCRKTEQLALSDINKREFDSSKLT